jgi:hypothetical protein
LFPVNVSPFGVNGGLNVAWPAPPPSNNHDCFEQPVSIISGHSVEFCRPSQTHRESQALKNASVSSIVDLLQQRVSLGVGDDPELSNC